MKELLPVLTILIGVLLWVPNIVFERAELYWLLTPLIGVMGAYFSYRNKRYFLLVINLIVACSYPLVMFLGTLFLGP